MGLFNNFGGKEINLMLVDDSRDILELSEMVLAKENNDFDIETTTDPDTVLERFENDQLDAVISDYDMPQMTGVELLEEIRETDQDFPFVLYTGKSTEDVAVEAINAGVTDYFQKEAGTEHYSLIANSVQNSVEQYREGERSYILREVVDRSDQPIVITNTDSEIVYVNPEHEEVTGYDFEDVEGENPRMFGSEDQTPDIYEGMYEALLSGEEFHLEGLENESRNGERYQINQQIIPISVRGNDPDYFAAIAVLD